MTTIEAEEQIKSYIRNKGIQQYDKEIKYGKSSTIYSKITITLTGVTIYLKHTDTGPVLAKESVFLEETSNQRSKRNNFIQRISEVSNSQVQGRSNTPDEKNKSKLVGMSEVQKVLVDMGIIKASGAEKQEDEEYPTIVNIISTNGKIQVRLSNNTIYTIVKDKSGEVQIESFQKLGSEGDRE